MHFLLFQNLFSYLHTHRPTAYHAETGEDFNIYGKHKKLTDDEARKAAAQLQEILGYIPNGKTEDTASKTVSITPPPSFDIQPENVELFNYGLPNDLGHLESLSHTESITAAYGPPPASSSKNPSDIYWQMAKKPSPEEIYLQKHPNEGYDYARPSDSAQNVNNEYKYNNYHATNNALKDLTPIIAALEVAKRGGTAPPQVQYSIEKNVHKQQDPRQFSYLPPTVQKSKYTYFEPSKSVNVANYRQVYNEAPRTRRQAHHRHHMRPKRRNPFSPAGAIPSEYEMQAPLMFNAGMMGL